MYVRACVSLPAFAVPVMVIIRKEPLEIKYVFFTSEMLWNPIFWLVGC